MCSLKLLMCICVLLSFCIMQSMESQKSVDHYTDQRASSYGCVCQNYSCGCCAHLEVPRIGLNDTGCANFSYLPKEYGIAFTVTIDNLTIYNETISARNPPPICFGAPMLKEYADLCLRFYDLNVTYSTAHGCVEIEARLHKIIVGTYKLGCFNLGKINGEISMLPDKLLKYRKSTFIPRNFISKLDGKTYN